MPCFEVGLSPQNKAYTFAFHGLACVTIQCVRYYISVNILAKYQYFIFAHFWRGGGGAKNPLLGKSHIQKYFIFVSLI